MNFPQLPNSVHQVLLLLSFILFFAYAFLDREVSEGITSSTNKHLIEGKDIMAKLSENLKGIQEQKLKMIRVAQSNNELHNLIEDTSKNILLFNINAIKSKFSDTAGILNLEMRMLSFKDAQLERELDLTSNLYNTRLEYLEKQEGRSIVYFWCGFISLILGLLSLRLSKQREENFKMHELGIIKIKSIERCQSCGRKFNSMLKNGSNADGETNESYCVECYDEGKFVDPSATKETIIQQAIARRKPYKNSPFKSDVTRIISTLERWNPDEY